MKDLDIVLGFKRDEIKTVICKSDGNIKYCNALSADGTCIVKDCLCSLAVAAIVKAKNCPMQYLAIRH